MTFPAQLGALEAPGLTQTSTIYDRLRADLLEARLEPGLKLSMRLLMERYDIGQTPLREALNRLSAERLVECRDQRGFSVAPISLGELRELTETRCSLEVMALRQGMAARTPEWEEQLLLAHHRLSRTPRSLNKEEFQDNPEWERLHRLFHRTLINQCGSRFLTDFCRQLADLLYRYRRLSISKAFRWREVNAEHQLILNHVLAGETEAAGEALAHHYKLTASIMLENAPAEIEPAR